MKKIAIVVCLAMLLGMLAGCVSDKAYVPSGDGLADQTKPTQPEQTQPEGGIRSSRSLRWPITRRKDSIHTCAPASTTGCCSLCCTKACS